MEMQYLSDSEGSNQEEYINELQSGKRARKIITSPELDNYPHKNIGLILSRGKSQLLKATGWLIAKDLVVTAAHFLREVERNEPITFYPGQNKLVDGYEVSEFRYDRFFKQCAFSQYSAKYDYALMKLKRPVERDRYIDILPDYIFQQEEIGIYGYPGDQVYVDEQEIQAWQQGAFEIGLKKVEEGVLIHHLSTKGGMSGSPIFVKRQKRLVAVAIHKGGVRLKTQIKNGQPLNAARVINSQVLANILKWEKEMTPSAIRLYNSQGSSSIESSSNQLLDINTKQKECPWDLTTPYANRFLIEGHKATLKAVNNIVEWVQIATKHYINQAKDKMFSIRLKMHEHNQGIFIGFILKSRKTERDSDYYSPETICCSLSPGTGDPLTHVLNWNGDLPKIDFLNVVYPTELTIQFKNNIIKNTTKQMIWICENQKVKIQVPERFNKEHYYVFASMLPDCSIQLCS